MTAQTAATASWVLLAVVAAAAVLVVTNCLEAVVAIAALAFRAANDLLPLLLLTGIFQTRCERRRVSPFQTCCEHRQVYISDRCEHRTVILSDPSRAWPGIGISVPLRMSWSDPRTAQTSDLTLDAMAGQ